MNEAVVPAHKHTALQPEPFHKYARV